VSRNTPTSAPTAGAGKSRLTPGEVLGQCDRDGSSPSSFPANSSPRMLRCYQVSYALCAAQISKQGSRINFSRDTRRLPDPARVTTWKAEELVSWPGLLLARVLCISHSSHLTPQQAMAQPHKPACHLACARPARRRAGGLSKQISISDSPQEAQSLKQFRCLEGETGTGWDFDSTEVVAARALTQPPAPTPSWCAMPLVVCVTAI